MCRPLRVTDNQLPSASRAMSGRRQRFPAAPDQSPMTGTALFTANVLFAWSAYLVGTASPGPSNLAIMSIATSTGRKAAFAFAAGVVSGSFFWAVLAALGLSAVLVAFSGFLVMVKIFGGLYLLWLAFKSGRSALTAK